MDGSTLPKKNSDPATNTKSSHEQISSEDSSAEKKKSEQAHTASGRDDSVDIISSRELEQHMEHDGQISSTRVAPPPATMETIPRLQPLQAFEPPVNRGPRDLLPPINTLAYAPNWPSSPIWRDIAAHRLVQGQQDPRSLALPNLSLISQTGRPYYYQPNLPNQYGYYGLPPINPATARREIDSPPDLQHHISRPSSTVLRESYDITRSRASESPHAHSSSISPTANPVRKSDENESTASSMDQDDDSAVVQDEDDIDDDTPDYGIEYDDDDDDDCGSLDDESIDGDLSRFEEIRMGQAASDIPYDASGQLVAPLVTHRSLASLTPERQKEMVQQFPSLNGRAQVPAEGLGQTFSKAERTALGNVSTVLWEEEGTICLVVELNGLTVTRRCDNNMVNGTKLLNSAIITRGRRDGILKGERVRHVVKVGGMEFKGVWIPFERAIEMAKREKVLEGLFPLFVSDIEAIMYSPSNRSRQHQMLNRGSHRNPQFLDWISGIPKPADNTSINSRPGKVLRGAKKPSSSKRKQEIKQKSHSLVPLEPNANPNAQVGPLVPVEPYTPGLVGAVQTSMWPTRFDYSPQSHLRGPPETFRGTTPVWPRNTGSQGTPYHHLRSDVHTEAMAIEEADEHNDDSVIVGERQFKPKHTFKREPDDG